MLYIKFVCPGYHHPVTSGIKSLRGASEVHTMLAMLRLLLWFKGDWINFSDCFCLPRALWVAISDNLSHLHSWLLPYTYLWFVSILVIDIFASSDNVKGTFVWSLMQIDDYISLIIEKNRNINWSISTAALGKVTNHMTTRWAAWYFWVPASPNQPKESQ